MPSLILKTMKTVWVTDKPWTSPDGKVTIWTIKLEDPQGERGDYNTMSKQIATDGWSGDIEMYTNAKGKEYVRKAPQEEPVTTTQPHQSDEYWSDRNDAIKAQFAIKVAVELLKNPEADVAEDTIEHWAKIFFNMVERVAKPEVKSDTGPELDENGIPF